MIATAKNLVSIAAAEVGYKEKKSNAQLDSKTANAGSNNYTKYARDLKAAGYYNGNKQGAAWCDVFVDWCFFKLCGNKTAAEKMQYQTGNLGAGTAYSANYYKNASRYYYSSPNVGDQIFFKKNGKICHTGIIEKIVGNTIYTIEGNSGDMVKRHTYTIGNSYIDGYGRPTYEEEAEQIIMPAVQPKKVTVELEQISKGSKGELVKTAQRLLFMLGYKGKDGKALEIDGSFGANTDFAVKAFQTAEKIKVDGYVGTDTWSRLLK